MGFDLLSLLEARRPDARALHEQHLNRQVPRLLRTIGFDRSYLRGSGAYLFDADGNRYLDLLAGFGVFAVGRNHPTVLRALHDVLQTDLADMVQFDAPLLPGLLGEQLLARAPGMERVYFCNSGAEAVETALKFARRATGRRRIVYCQHGYHGVTTGALSVNGAGEFRRGFDPLLPDIAIPFGRLDALQRALRKGDVAAMVVEPIQGKGVHVPPSGFLSAAASLLHEHGALLICDEVQTGIGRTGAFFGYEHENVDPDIVTVAKALSGGFVPVGATLAKDWIFERVYSSLDRVFVHASTFAGNALGMAAGLATLAVIEDEGLLENTRRTGEAIRSGLQSMAERYELIGDVRGRGLMVGIEFSRPRSLRLQAVWSALQVARRGLFAQLVTMPLFAQHRILTQVAGDHMNVVKLLPPLVIGEAEVACFLEAFADVMDQLHGGHRTIRRYGGALVKELLR
jgi:acetylornithine/succinyldiaminopimelate/putrescine aminotransferase